MGSSANNCLLYTLAFIFFCLANCGCVAVSQRRYWSYSEMPIRPDESTSSIKISLQKESIWLPLPVAMWEIGSKNYQLAIDFHTPTLEYQQFDSIFYQIQTVENKLITSGTLSLLNGQVDTFSMPKYSFPAQYIIRCATRPRLRIGNQRQPLMGSFIIYTRNHTGRPTIRNISPIQLRYHKAIFYSIL